MDYKSLTFDGFLHSHRIKRASNTKEALGEVNRMLLLLMRDTANNMSIGKKAWRQDFTAADLPSQVKDILAEVYDNENYQHLANAVTLLTKEDEILAGVEVMKQALTQLLDFININGPLGSIDSDRISEVLAELNDLAAEAVGDSFYETPIVRAIVGYDMLMDDIRG
jgi:hypothetical protein